MFTAVVVNLFSVLSVKARRVKSALFFPALLLSLLSYPARGDIHIVRSGEAPHYISVSNDITQYLESVYSDVRVTRNTIGQFAPTPSAPTDLIIAIGTDASEFVNNHYPSNPSLNLFITHQTWETLHAGKPQRAAVLLDQPISRYLRLGTIIAPEAQHIGTVFGRISITHRAPLLKQSEQLGLVLLSQQITRDSNPLQVLSGIFDRSDVFLALPDEALFNRNIARWALHLGYKNQIPVIGFSRSYTRAGAVASLYSGPEDISRQSLEWLKQQLSENAEDIWQAANPRYFTVSVNQRVARILGLELDESELTSRLTLLEREAAHFE